MFKYINGEQKDKMGAFDKIKDRILGGSEDLDYEDFEEDEYLEIDTARESAKQKITIKPFVIEDFTDIKPALDSLREGMTIALVNIRPLKDRDIVELKRAVNKLKKTCDAIDGDIAGFGDDWIVVTPGFARVFRSAETDDLEEQ